MSATEDFTAKHPGVCVDPRCAERQMHSHEEDVALQFVKLTEPGWRCAQLACTGGDVLIGRRASWIGPSSGQWSWGEERDKYCGTCKRDAIKAARV